MKILTLLVALVLLGNQAWADCTPFDVALTDDTLKGCGTDWELFKQRNLRITFPDGYSEDRFPAGKGGCGQSTSCDATGFLVNILYGLTECWPQFDTPLRHSGLWSQTVHNQFASQKLRQCSSTVYTVAGPVVCVEHPLLAVRTSSVVHTCNVVWENYGPSTPLWTIPYIYPDAQPCYVRGFLEGSYPCWDPFYPFGQLP